MVTKLSKKSFQWLLQRINLNYAGLVVGLLAYLLSLTPSLLPRIPLYQSVISGISLAIGYGLGVTASWLYRKLELREPNVQVKKYFWLGLGATSAVLVVFASRLSILWQNDIRTLVGELPDASSAMFKILFISTIIFVVILVTARGVRFLNRKLFVLLDRWLPNQVAYIGGLVLFSLLLIWSVNGFLIGSLETIADNTYKSKNSQTPDGLAAPFQAARSGSPGSLVSWETIGAQGQQFVARGPSQEQLQKFSAEKPMQQIRVYAGVNSADNATERAQLVLDELIRTDAFSRQVLVVATATGTGWLEPQSTDSIEYMYNGDSAIASMQYSYLPSWMATLVDKDSAAEAGQLLFNTIYDYHESLPSDNRPKLIAYGLSLGSFGSQAAFSGSHDLASRTDGALFMGTPSFSSPWDFFTNNRDSGSPERLPTYDGAKSVGFAATNQDIDDLEKSANWKGARTLYLQHGSDPVVWWNPDLILHEPDWLKETAAPDVTPRFSWVPILTFLQVTVDQFVGTSPPNGYGHNYVDKIANSWAAVAPAPNWTDDDTQRLQELIDAN